MRALCRSLRLGERCTPGQGALGLQVLRCACSRTQGARLSAECVCVCVCVSWRSADKGGQCVALRGPRRARLQSIFTPAGLPPLPARSPLTAQRVPCIACDRHHYQQWRAARPAGAGQRRGRRGAWSGRRGGGCSSVLPLASTLRVRPPPLASSTMWLRIGQRGTVHNSLAQRMHKHTLTHKHTCPTQTGRTSVYPLPAAL